MGGAPNTPGIVAAIAAMDPDAWIEHRLHARRGGPGVRVQVRRPAPDRAPHPAHRRGPASSLAGWRHFGFLTDLDGDAAEVDAFHRDHATMSAPSFRSRMASSTVSTFPLVTSVPNRAWLQCALLAHNLIRWTATLGQPGHVDRLTVARPMRVRLITVPGRLVNRAGICTLRPVPG